MARSFTAASSEYLQDSNAISTLDSFSISFWCKTTTSANGQSFLGVVEDGTAELINIETNKQGNGTNAANYTRVHMRANGSLQDIYDFNNSAVYDGTWRHHLVVRDGGTPAYYLDGSSQTLNSADTSLDTTQFTHSRTFSFGARNARGTIDQFCDCEMAEIAIYNVALTTEDAAMLGSGYRPLMVKPQEILRYWPVYGNNSPEIELFAASGGTLSGTSKTAHPPVIYATNTENYMKAAAAAGTSIKDIIGSGIIPFAR